MTANKNTPKNETNRVSELLPIQGGVGKLLDGLSKIAGLFKKK
jgi:hypothetical protein